ncbi:MAG: sigma-54-dependent Fis family transcriptional regulator [bacterium]|nr:sigma-54-dependent Fis family transcriptional regulator [bacterium]
MARLGAFQCLGDQFTPSEIEEVVTSAAEQYQDRRITLFGAPSTEPWKNFLVGESSAMASVHQVIRLIGARRSTVLIAGETGTGKEMVARAIHMASPRGHLPMVAVNCSALPENLLEAELFGHVKGAFTGAVNSRVGRFEQAHRSTIFLDEIGDMPLDLQAKLLRVLQEREFQRLGSSETTKVDVRVLAASNVDLVERVRQGKFREDLYYRLNVVPLMLPPLRERRRDIPLLVQHFVRKICQAEDLPPRQVSPETITRLARFEWPGNVRQLENAVEMAIALSGDRLTLYPGDFPLPSTASAKPLRPSSPVISVPDDGIDFEETVGGIERALLEQAMNKTGGNKKQAADMLGLKRTTFTAKLKSLGTAATACAAN